MKLINVGTDGRPAWVSVDEIAAVAWSVLRQETVQPPPYDLVNVPDDMEWVAADASFIQFIPQTEITLRCGRAIVSEQSVADIVETLMSDVNTDSY